MRPEMCASTTWPLSSSTRNVVLGKVSTTLPSIWMLSSFAMMPQVCPGLPRHGLVAADGAQILPDSPRLFNKRAFSVDALPAGSDQLFVRAEAALVGHLAAGGYPIAQIDPPQTAVPCLVDLPEHRIGAEAAEL